MAQDAPKGTKLEFETSGKLKGTSVVAAQKGTTVQVENIFQNLPVRRRELERKIKGTEWNRVIQHLGQYACIQTGVKLSVSHQPTKGKKTTLFSTKGNPTTRENIVNVFGSKMLIGLLPLELKLEMEPTSGPSQRWSTQEDGGTKDISIIGHISKPGSGGGQAMKDKQMFYVNSRPCQLPQVKSVFNEVFKTFDPSNHPFVFANVLLDTHLYDVNVSPDKRTILLHDQTRMLEHLRESLAAILDTGDRSMPISQLSVQKQPAYKQLTISRSETPATEAADTPRTKVTEKNSSLEDEESSNEDTETVKDQTESGRARSRKPSFQLMPKNPVSMQLKDVLGTKEKPNLISDWLATKTDNRIEPRETSEDNAVKQPFKVDGLSKEKRRLIEKFSRESEKSKEVVDSQLSASPGGTPIPSYHPPRQVQDFNERLAELEYGSRPNSVTDKDNNGDTIQELDTTGDEVQEPIPALALRFKPSTPGFLGAASQGMRPPPPRTPLTEATISIGGRSITSSLGTPVPTNKRQRTDDGPSINSTVNNGPTPSFGSLLSQRFAASGITQAPASAEGNDSQTSISDIFATSRRANQDMEEDGPESSEELDAIAANENEEGSVVASSSIVLTQDNDSDDEYVDEETKKVREDQKVQKMIQQAEEKAAQPTEDNKKRAASILNLGARRKDSTTPLVRTIKTSVTKIGDQIHNLSRALASHATIKSETIEIIDADFTNPEAAEERLSLTVSKSDFSSMKIIGQFNLGFIIASHSSSKKGSEDDKISTTEDIFIIDQHASDEKYNFERLQSITVVQSQRLVHPKSLDLTAIEEETVMEHLAILEKNGFIVKVDREASVGRRCQLISLPLSRETVFSLEDLEELINILGGSDEGTTIVPRPSKVRKMFAMRACRSSIMIGKTLTNTQMGKVVKHMGEIDKPWNCPHGRPTMRHLCELGAWDRMGWKEGDYVDGEKGVVVRGTGTDWQDFVQGCRDKKAEEHSDDNDDVEDMEVEDMEVDVEEEEEEEEEDGEEDVNMGDA